MKKKWSDKEIKTIFKDLDTLCKREIIFHKEQQMFIKGLEQVRKYIIKQYFNIVKDCAEGESILPCANLIRGKSDK